MTDNFMLNLIRKAQEIIELYDFEGPTMGTCEALNFILDEYDKKEKKTMWHDLSKEKPAKSGLYLVAVCHEDVAFLETGDYFKKGDFITYTMPENATIKERIFGGDKLYADREGFYAFLSDELGARWDRSLNENMHGPIYWMEPPEPPMGLKWAEFDGKE